MASLLWPAACLLARSPALFARAHAAVLLASACLFLGVAAFLPFYSGALLAAAPFLPALLLRSACSSSPLQAALGKDSYKLLLFIILFFGLALFGLGIPAYHYDGLLYHLPSAALAWQQHSLFPLAAHPQIGTNPMLSELPKIWAFACAGNDSLVHLQQIPALAGLLFLTLLLSRGSLLAGFALLLVPKVFEQCLSANVDLVAGLWGASAAYFLARRNRPAAALTLLIFAQLKYTTFLPAALGALVLFFSLWREKKSRALLWGLLFLTLGGSWEWHNLAERRNPTYPYQLISSRFRPELAQAWIVSERDPKKWEGYYLNYLEKAANSERASLFRLWRAWGDAAFVPYDEFSGRWGPFWFLLALPGSLCFLVLQLLRRRPAASLRALGFALLFFAFTPKNWETRFGIFLLPFGLAYAAWGLRLAGRTRLERIVSVTVAILVLLSCGWRIARSHPFPALRSAPHADALALASREEGIKGVAALAARLDALNPPTLWIDFTHGQAHHYGMAANLLYPYFSHDWQRRISVVESAPLPGQFLKELAQAQPTALLLQAGSSVNEDGLALLGYHLLEKNGEGSLYARP